MYRFIDEMLNLGFEVGKSYFPKKQNSKLCWYVEATDEEKEDNKWAIPPKVLTALSDFKVQEATGEFRPQHDLMPALKIIPNDYYIGANDFSILTGQWIMKRDTDRIIFQAGQLHIFTVLKSYEI